MSRQVPAVIIKLATDPFTLGDLAPTDDAEHVDSDPPSALPITCKELGHVRMPRVVFLRFAAPLLVPFGIDYSATVIPQVLRTPRAGLASCYVSRYVEQFHSQR